MNDELEAWCLLDKYTGRDFLQCLYIEAECLYTLTGRQKEYEGTKEVIRIGKSKDRQHNGQNKKDKQRSTKHTHIAKDGVTRTPTLFDPIP